MGKMQRDKGNRFERSIVNAFKAHDIDAKRVPLSGATDFAKGDILAPIKGKGWRFELKARADGFKSLYGWLTGNDALIVKADYQEALVIMPLSTFIGLVSEPKEKPFVPSKHGDSVYDWGD